MRDHRPADIGRTLGDASIKLQSCAWRGLADEDLELLAELADGAFVDTQLSKALACAISDD
jgi:hypothetical protein